MSLLLGYILLTLIFFLQKAGFPLISGLVAVFPVKILLALAYSRHPLDVLAGATVAHLSVSLCLLFSFLWVTSFD